MNKTIQFNSEFLSTVSKKKSLNGTRKKEKPCLSDKNNSKVLRQKLLERIKEYQNKTTEQKTETSAPIVSPSVEQPMDNTFNDSLEILKELSSGIGHNKTVKHRPSDSDVSIEMPDCFDPNTNTIEEVKDNKGPLYSSIKNGSKPTYKEFIKNSEEIVDISNNNVQIDTTTNPSILAPNSSTENIKNKRPHQTRKKMVTKTYKYLLGKNGRNVSVLLKDMKTRKMVKKECSQLRDTPIHDIKQYLRKKNLLKIGSNATDDVVTKIYEQAILTGEVRNMSKDTLIHNFMKS